MNRESHWSVMKKTFVQKMEATFRECPQCFFSEHDIHSVLYHLATEELKHYGINSKETTQNEYITSLVHHEYPTPFRCDMKGYKFRRMGEEKRTQKGGLYKRGHYDLVILNPDFVKNNTIDMVCGKNYKKLRSILANLSIQLLIWASEIIYFPKIKKLPKNAIKIIKQDTLKIKETINSNFCKIGFVHVFTSHPHKEAARLEQQIAQLAEKEQIEITFTTA
jgi:hypothetical protein